MSYERSLPMAMLPNDSHPGPGCSCEACLRAHPEPEVCERCHGTGLVTISYGGDGYGNRCAAMVDADDQPCGDCDGTGKAS